MLPKPHNKTDFARRVLIVDDDEDFADSVSDLLERRGHEIAKATTPDDGTRTIAAFNPQVVLIDIRLGRESGVDLLAKIMAQYSDLTCVMITAQAETETAIAAMRRGAYDYYEKSSNPEGLYAILDRAFERLSLAQAHRAAQQEVLQQSQRFEAALNNMSQGLCMFDADRRLIVCNRQYVAMYGLPPELARTGAAWRDIVSHRLMNIGYTGLELQEVIAEHEKTNLCLTSAVYTRELRDGRIILISHQPLAEGGWIATHDDVTERRKSEARIAHMAGHDALTDLPNRVLFREAMDQALSRMRRGENFAVMLIDLDRFKETNDTLGHPVGDALLRASAERLMACMREVDTVARLGGDEFAIIQPSIARPEDSSALATRILETLSEPYEIQGNQIVIGASIGIALAPQDGNDPDQLLRNADMALYRAKGDGRGTSRFFEAEMDARLQARRGLELDLRQGIMAGEFELYYQPLVDIETLMIKGFEALLRWKHRKRGMVSPAEFIPLAEETGLIAPLGEWVIRTACREAIRWPDQIKVAVNLSPCQFRARNLVQTVKSALCDAGLAPQRLELEITESVLLDDNEATLATLHEIRDLGVRISMDDFGTGYSSLSYLRSFPFDKIKIDRSFVKDLEHKDAMAIIGAVCSLGKTLGMATTAEGVETEAQLQKVAAKGCTEAQGFLFSVPVPAHSIDGLLTEFGKRKPEAA